MKGFAMLSINNVGWIEKKSPVLGLYDAIVRPLAISPCTSDIHTVFEGAIGDKHDMILGHEAVGQIVEIGSEVKDFKVGDRVIVPAITTDWRALEVQEGFHKPLSGLLAGWKFSNFKDGVFADCFHVNDADVNLALLPKEISLENAVMITDIMNNGFHGAELAEIEMGSSVAVIGIGPVGLMAVAGSKLRGAGRIIGVGSRPACVEAAKFYGATDIVNYKNGNIVKEIMELTNGKGVDRVIMTGGGTETLGQAVAMVVPGGIISNVNYYGIGEYFQMPRIDWGCGRAHKIIRVGLCPGGRIRMEMLRDLVLYNRVDLSRLITHKFTGFENIEKALLLMKDKPKDLIKAVVIL